MATSLIDDCGPLVGHIAGSPGQVLRQESWIRRWASRSERIIVELTLRLVHAPMPVPLVPRVIVVKTPDCSDKPERDPLAIAHKIRSTGTCQRVRKIHASTDSRDLSRLVRFNALPSRQTVGLNRSAIAMSMVNSRGCG